MTTRKKIDFFIFRFFVSKTTQRERGGRGLSKTGLKMFESAMVVSGERVDLCADAGESSCTKVKVLERLYVFSCECP